MDRTARKIASTDGHGVMFTSRDNSIADSAHADQGEVTDTLGSRRSAQAPPTGTRITKRKLSEDSVPADEVRRFETARMKASALHPAGAIASMCDICCAIILCSGRSSDGSPWQGGRHALCATRELDICRPETGNVSHARSRTDESSAREAKMAEAIRTILECLGEDPGREGLIKTPERYAKALLWMTRGYEEPISGTTLFCGVSVNHTNGRRGYRGCHLCRGP